MPWSYVAAAVGVGSLLQGYQAGKRMDAAAGQAAEAAQLQFNIQDRLTKMSEEEWQLYKEKALPLIDKLVAESNVPDRSEEEMSLAADETKTAYAAGRQALLRRVNLEESAGGPRAGALLAPSYMDEASAVSRAVTEARRREKARVEDTSWGRKLQTVGVLQRLPQNASANLQGASAAAGRAGETASRVSNSYGQQAAQLAYGAGYLGRNAARWMARGSGGADAIPDGQDDFMSPYEPSQGISDDVYYSDVARDGGKVTRRGVLAPPRVKSNYADGGPIRGPGSGMSDSVKGAAEEGSYILSADTVRAIGHSKIQKIMEQAGVRPGFGGDDRGGVPVRLSNGEYQIPRRAVDFHGEEFFNKLQQKYHRPTMQDDDGMANGGAIRRKLLPSIVEEAIYNSMPSRALASRRKG